MIVKLEKLTFRKDYRWAPSAGIFLKIFVEMINQKELCFSHLAMRQSLLAMTVSASQLIKGVGKKE